MLVAFSGLSGVGKSTIAQALAKEVGGVWLRIDSIEQALRHSGALRDFVNDAGYCVAYEVAEDNLRLGRIVISDSVNAWSLVRDAWCDVARRSSVGILEIEVVCSDRDEHRRRVETRSSEVPGLVLPNWEKTISRDYHPWDRDRLVVDTAGTAVAENVAFIRSRM